MEKNLYECKADRGGFVIGITKSGNIRLYQWSLYNDEPNTTRFIVPNSEYNAKTDWSKLINESGTTMAEKFIHELGGGTCQVIKTIIH